MLSVNAYKKYVPIILARGVSERTAACILENNQSLTGIEIGEDWDRVYTGGEAFLQIVGGNTDYHHLSEEIQEYISYITDKIEILNMDSVDKEDEAYKRWKAKSGISVKEFLTYAFKNGWIAAGVIDSERGYFTTDEMFDLMIESIEEKVADDSEFEKVLFKFLLFENRNEGREVCLILYDQHVLSVADDDYEKLVSGAMDAFSFIKKKIEELKITPAQLALDPCSASAVVVQRETGKVLALVSYPGYDNNRLANQMDSVYYNGLLNDKALPLYNRATQQLTAPGSTFKPITIIAGLQEGVISSDSPVFCDGVFDKVFPNLKCWKHTGHGNIVNAPTALQNSCNDYLKRESPIFENCVISEFDADNLYVILPKELSVTDLNIKFDYGGEETVTAQYYSENHLVGQLEFTVEGIQTGNDSIENKVQEQVSDNMEDESHSLNGKYIIFVSIVGIFTAGIILKVLIQKRV